MPWARGSLRRADGAPMAAGAGPQKPDVGTDVGAARRRRRLGPGDCVEPVPPTSPGPGPAACLINGCWRDQAVETATPSPRPSSEAGICGEARVHDARPHRPGACTDVDRACQRSRDHDAVPLTGAACCPAGHPTVNPSLRRADETRATSARSARSPLHTAPRSGSAVLRGAGRRDGGHGLRQSGRVLPGQGHRRGRHVLAGACERRGPGGQLRRGLGQHPMSRAMPLRRRARRAEPARKAAGARTPRARAAPPRPRRPATGAVALRCTRFTNRPPVRFSLAAVGGGGATATAGNRHAPPVTGRGLVVHPSLERVRNDTAEGPPRRGRRGDRRTRRHDRAWAAPL